MTGLSDRSPESLRRPSGDERSLRLDDFAMHSEEFDTSTAEKRWISVWAALLLLTFLVWTLFFPQRVAENPVPRGDGLREHTERPCQDPQSAQGIQGRSDGQHLSLWDILLNTYQGE